MKKPVPVTKIIWAIVCLFFVVLWSADFYTALKTPEAYPFGSEGPVAGWWSYKTQQNYLISGMILIVWFLIGLAFCLFQHKREKLKYGIAVHIAATCIYIVSCLLWFK